MKQRLPRCYQSGNYRILNIRRVIINIIRLSRMQHIKRIDLTLMRIDEKLHLCIQIAFILECQLQILAGLAGQQRIIYHWCFAHLT